MLISHLLNLHTMPCWYFRTTQRTISRHNNARERLKIAAVSCRPIAYPSLQPPSSSSSRRLVLIRCQRSSDWRRRRGRRRRPGASDSGRRSWGRGRGRRWRQLRLPALVLSPPLPPPPPPRPRRLSWMLPNLSPCLIGHGATCDPRPFHPPTHLT